MFELEYMMVVFDHSSDQVATYNCRTNSWKPFNLVDKPITNYPDTPGWLFNQFAWKFPVVSESNSQAFQTSSLPFVQHSANHKPTNKTN